MDESQQTHAAELSDKSRDSVLLHLAYPLWRKHLLVGVARAKELQDEGHDVTVTYCDATNGTCAANYFSNPVVCKICRTRAKATGEQAGLNLVPLSVAAAESSSSVSASETEQLTEGVQSGITSAFRSLPDDTSTSSFIQSTKRRYLQTSCALLRSMKGVVQAVRPSRIEVFSGRHACSRFALLAARAAQIPFNTLEITITKRPIVFRGHTPHDRKQIQRRIQTHPVDIEFADAFYRKRRQPGGNRHTKGQVQTFTPPVSDGYRKKVAIFLSSQDEFEALGRDWKSSFDDYANVVAELCEENPDTLFCIRFHPNQGEMTSDVVSPFDRVRGCKNVHLYLPDDTVNTYHLIEWSDTVITFGSTVTVEACWMGKPVILLGRSFFDGLGVAYVPESMDEALALLK
ncbi:MAG: hypothetical protein HKN47_18850, partial [Pirellulaceae bacterium]|nr:hypothetical protein [Pirellulaceae bacterium]